MEPVLATIGAHVRRLRKARGLTQGALGQAVGINANLLGRIERGEQNLTVLTLARLAAGLEVSLSDLVQDCPPLRLTPPLLHP